MTTLSALAQSAEVLQHLRRHYDVVVNRSESGALRYGIITSGGNIILPFEYDSITIFTDIDTKTGANYEVALASKNGVEYRFELVEK